MSNDTKQSFAPVLQEQHDLMSIDSARAIQEVQAQVIMAKKFPRNHAQAVSNIIEACKSKELANDAMYLYPRGGEEITGPSIRLAEVVAQCWGNIKAGVEELSNEGDRTMMRAFCWDMETNTVIERKFSAPHYRSSKYKGRQRLTDDRDIYENSANLGARRLRACIIGCVPRYVWEKAVSQVRLTLVGKSNRPIAERVVDILEAFKPHGIDDAMLEAKLGHPTTQVNEEELVTLRSIYNSIKDGNSKREDWFKLKLDPPVSDALGAAAKAIKNKKEETMPPAD